jgi:hypothetical protein
VKKGYIQPRRVVIWAIYEAIKQSKFINDHIDMIPRQHCDEFSVEDLLALLGYDYMSHFNDEDLKNWWFTIYKRSDRGNKVKYVEIVE